MNTCRDCKYMSQYRLDGDKQRELKIWLRATIVACELYYPKIGITTYDNMACVNFKEK